MATLQESMGLPPPKLTRAVGVDPFDLGLERVDGAAGDMLHDATEDSGAARTHGGGDDIEDGKPGQRGHHQGAR